MLATTVVAGVALGGATAGGVGVEATGADGVVEAVGAAGERRRTPAGWRRVPPVPRVPAGADRLVCARPPPARRRSGPGTLRGGRGLAAGGDERHAVPGGVDPAMSGGPPDGPPRLGTVLGGGIQRCRRGGPRRRRRLAQGARADRERDEPEDHDGGNAGDGKTDGGGAQQRCQWARGARGGRRRSCRRAGRLRAGGRGLRVRGDGGGLVSGCRTRCRGRSRCGLRTCASCAGSGGRSLAHDRLMIGGTCGPGPLRATPDPPGGG